VEGETSAGAGRSITASPSPVTFQQLALVREDAPQHEHSLREVFNALRYLVKTGAPWRYLPIHFPPWWAVYQQTQRWMAARVFESMAEDLRILLRLAAGRTHLEATAVILDSRTLQSTPESGHRAGWEGAKRWKGSKLHLAVDTLGHLLAIHVTPADEQDRAQVGSRTGFRLEYPLSPLNAGLRAARRHACRSTLGCLCESFSASCCDLAHSKSLTGARSYRQLSQQ
jgi:transposase